MTSASDLISEIVILADMAAKLDSQPALSRETKKTLMGLCSTIAQLAAEASVSISDESKKYDVVLLGYLSNGVRNGCGGFSRKIDVIKELREICRLPLAEAKRLVDLTETGDHVDLQEELDFASARQIADRLQSAGAQVEIMETA